MNERWKPKNLEVYWSVIDTTPMHFAWQGNPLEIARWEAGNVFKTQDQALIASINIKSLLLSLHEPVTNSSQLPKLTAEVFDRPDCPEWAKYAAVDKNGRAYFYSTKPEHNLPSLLSRAQCIWYVPLYKNKTKGIPGKWDASDWQNSLIKRPSKDAFDKLLKNHAEQQANKILQKAREHRLSEQYHNGPEKTTLPDWCKQGEWIYSRHTNSYDKITAIEDDCYYCVKTENKCHYTIDYIKEDIVPARLRPYNADEIPDLPFEVSDKNSDFRTIVTSCKGDKVWLGGATTAISTEELLREFTVDGQPAGVLEHLENGEWVK